ncbi:MAG: O-antigen ligase family protein [candidate division WOR-3 bacterium]|nr:O-antigen ligase family protein [candidate division WOR-3 bacterium]
MLQFDDTRQSALIFLTFILFQILLIYGLILKPTAIAVLTAAVLALFLAIAKIDRLFIAVIIALLVIPASGYNYPPFTFSINLIPLYFALISFVFFLFLNVLLKRKKFGKIRLAIPVGFFILWILVCALVGLANGNSFPIIKNDLLILCLFGLYFIIPTVVSSPKTFSRILLIIVICSGVIAFEYFLVFLTTLQRGELIRLNPNQGIIYLFAIPLMIGMAIRARSKAARWLFVCLLALCFGAIGITLTRGLWISLIIASLIMAYLFRKEINKKYVLGTVAFIFVAFIIVIFYFTQKTGLSIFTLVSIRASSLLSFTQDISLNQRLVHSQLVWKQILQSPLIGNGLGKQFSHSYFGTTLSFFWIDNSYLVLLWKLGIVGTLTFLGIVVKSLIESIKIFKKTTKNDTKIYSGAMIAFLISWLLLATISPLMIKYFLNIFWITLIAMIDCVKNFGNENYDSDI